MTDLASGIRTPYPASEADDYEPMPAAVELTEAVRNGKKLMRWRLQHFSDDHATELEYLLNAGALAEPDPSSAGLAMIAHRHWMEMQNVHPCRYQC